MIYYLEDDEQIRNLALYTLEQTGHATRGFSRASEMGRRACRARCPICSFST